MSDPTDPGGVSGAHERPSRTTRVGDSGSPVGSPLTIVLAVIAVAAGFLIFRSISDDGNAGSIGELPGANTTVAPGGTTPTVTPAPGDTPAAGATTTAPSSTQTRSGATVVVANASSSGGVAAPMSEQLTELGYTMGEPTSQVDGPDNLETSIVYFSVANNSEAVARSVAIDMGGLDVEAMPEPIPVEGGIIDGPVLLMLGDDLAGEEVPGAPPAAPAAPTPAPTTATTAG